MNDRRAERVRLRRRVVQGTVCTAAGSLIAMLASFGA